jgi:hypothetical protein
LNCSFLMGDPRYLSEAEARVMSILCVRDCFQIRKQL